MLEDGTFYSAAHVFKLYEDSVYDIYYLRDKNNKTYKINSVTKFETNRDFISFTVEGFVPENNAGLLIETDIKLNTQVFSVGNALGDGIVIRSGILTSQTYETENGGWKWLRFSAAASPGNSGGPWITEDGKVLGIITMKSENENLNYALPFAETKATAENFGIMQNSFYYNLPNIMNENFYHKYKKTVELPMDLDALRKELTSSYKDYSKKIVESLRKQFSPMGKKGFAKSSDKAEIMNKVFMSEFPYTFYLSDSNKWLSGYPSSIYEFNIEDNCYIKHGSMMGYTMGMIFKPDSISL